MKLSVRLVVLFFALASCDDPPRDRCEARGGTWATYRCHDVPGTSFVLVGKAVVPVATTSTECEHRCLVNGSDDGWRR
jgi:hypothetical protein